MTKCTSCRREFTTTYLKNGKVHKCCPDCREDQRRRNADKRRNDPDGIARYHRTLRRSYRERAFAAYGGACACCGETHYEFLVIDHPNGGGRAERKETAAWGGASFAQWLARQGYPPGYRVLCHNCNSAYGYYGYCPHQSSVRSA